MYPGNVNFEKLKYDKEKQEREWCDFFTVILKESVKRILLLSESPLPGAIKTGFII